MTWRAKAAPIIARALLESSGADEREVRRALRAAYPFGQRKYWPYKVWLDEIKRQRGFKPLTKQPPVDPRQLTIFDRIEGRS